MDGISIIIGVIVAIISTAILLSLFFIIAGMFYEFDFDIKQMIKFIWIFAGCIIMIPVIILVINKIKGS